MDVSGSAIAGVPAGVVLPYAGSTAPQGYLLCDGSLVSRTVYARLFEAISTSFGAGDGSTTFKLPDLRGRTSIGAGAGSSLTARTLAATGGEETHLLTSAEMPSHTHTQNSHFHGVTDPGHSHTIPGSGASGVAPGAGGGAPGSSTNQATTGISINSTTATNQNTGGGGAHNNMQPFVVLNQIIKF